MASDKPQNLEELIIWFKDASNRQIHGLRDNDEFDNKGILIEDKNLIRLEKIRKGYGELVCHCRYISMTMIVLLQEINIDARLVEWISDGKNPLDLRHTCFEFYFDNQYILSDIDAGILFLDSSSLEYFSALDTKKGFDANIVTSKNLYRLIQKKKVSPDFPVKDFQKIINDDYLLIQWYKPKTKAIMFNFDIYAGNISDENIQVIRANLVDSKKGKERFLTLKEFENKFYSKVH